MRRVALVGLLVSVGACTEGKTPALDLRDPASCEGCHQQVVAEWRTSMHAHAHQDADPIFGAMRAFRMKKQGAGVAAKCASCHSPVAPAPEDADTDAARAGVSCLACHGTAHVDRTGGKKGAAALARSEPLVLRGPHECGHRAAATRTRSTPLPTHQYGLRRSVTTLASPPRVRRTEEG